MRTGREDIKFFSLLSEKGLSLYGSTKGKGPRTDKCYEKNPVALKHSANSEIQELYSNMPDKLMGRS